jgi:inner membrane transporter RhtA
LVTTTFLAAIERIPLGTAVAVEFLGPLTVAAVRSHRRSALAWPALALVGVVLLTEPWHGDITSQGSGSPGWRPSAGYLHRAHPANRGPLHGITALSLTVPIASATAAIPRDPAGKRPAHSWRCCHRGRLAILLPVLPFALELLALRHMTHAAFANPSCPSNPPSASPLGLVVLSQQPSGLQLVGIVLVVLAGAGAQRGGRRGAQAPAGTAGPDNPGGPDVQSELGLV